MRYYLVLVVTLFGGPVLADSEPATSHAQDASSSAREICPPGFDCDGDVVVHETPIRDSLERAIPGFSSKDVVLEQERPRRTVRVSREALRHCPPDIRCIEEESFWSLTNLGLGAFQFGGAGYDTKTTMDAVALSGTYDVIRDGRPLTVTVDVFERSGPEQWFIDRGTPALGGYKALVNVPFWVGSHYLRRSDKRWVRIVGWTLPIALGAIQWKAGIDNRREIDRINGLIR